MVFSQELDFREAIDTVSHFGDSRYPFFRHSILEKVICAIETRHPFKEGPDVSMVRFFHTRPTLATYVGGHQFIQFD